MRKNRPPYKYIFLLLLTGLILAGLFFSKKSVSPKEAPIRPSSLSLAIPELPRKYRKNLDSVNNLTGFVVEDTAVRELVIAVKSPRPEQKKGNIEVQIISPRDTIHTEIFKEAVLYRYHDKIYGIFNAYLPFVNIKKILWKKQNQTGSILPAFQPVDYKTISYPRLPEADIKLPSHAYIPFYIRLLDDFNMGHLPYSYTEQADSLALTYISPQKYAVQNGKSLIRVKNSQSLDSIFSGLKSLNDNEIKWIGNPSAHKKLQQELSGKKAGELFDIPLFFHYLALQQLFFGDCPEDFYFQYNPERKLFEAFFTYTSCPTELFNQPEKPDFSRPETMTAYLQALQEVSRMNLDDYLKKYARSIKNELILINHYNLRKIFDKDFLKINQLIIQNNLNPEKELTTEYLSHDKKKLKLLLTNHSIYPVQLRDLQYKNKKITSLNRMIKAGNTDTLVIELPAHFNNLFVRKKKKKTGFNPYRNLKKMSVVYSLPGFIKTYQSEILPFTQEEPLNREDLFRQTSFHGEFLQIDEKNKIIRLKNKEIILDKALLIPRGYVFKVEAGNLIDIREGGKIISFSPVQFTGSAAHPVQIISKDGKGQGMVVFSEGEKNLLEHVIFDKLTNPRHGYWNISGAVTFYESPVKLNEVSFSNNTCEDALNIVRTDFEMTNCRFTRTQSDAFDGDFVTGKIINCKFTRPGNDGIDVSGSRIFIDKVLIEHANDKAVSAGEKSLVKIRRIEILNSEIGVASKDLSVVEIEQIRIKNTKLGFTAFQKKPEFGPAKISVKELEAEEVNQLYLIETGSELTINGRKAATVKQVKNKMYGVEFGVSSKQTRNK